MPVAERVPGPADGDGHPAARHEGHACLDGVDPGPGGRGDVDPEVEALGVAVSVPRVVQIRADRVLAVEGLDGPAVARVDAVAVADGAALRELRS